MQSATVTLRRRPAVGSESVAFGIYRVSTISNDYESLDHGSTLRLTVGDQLRMVVDRGSQLYSSYNYDISFFGMLLYYA